MAGWKCTNCRYRLEDNISSEQYPPCKKNNMESRRFFRYIWLEWGSPDCIYSKN